MRLHRASASDDVERTIGGQEPPVPICQTENAGSPSPERGGLLSRIEASDTLFPFRVFVGSTLRRFCFPIKDLNRRWRRGVAGTPPPSMTDGDGEIQILRSAAVLPRALRRRPAFREPDRA